MKQILGIFVLLYVFALLQMSFLVHIFPIGLIPNLIILTVVFLSILERNDSLASFCAALFGGFLIDIFSEGIIGFWPFVLVLISLFIKQVLQNYVRISIPQKF